MNSKLLKKGPIYDIARWLFKSRPYLSDEKQIKLIYKQRFGAYPDLNNPKNFNEKNNWRKLHERNDLYTKMVDKYSLKEIIKERCGEEHTFKLLDYWEDANDINIDNLPDKFVLKANHSGGILVCKDKYSFNLNKAKIIMKKALKEDYYSFNREWPYKNVKRKIIAEEYMGENLIDYKNYCFNGELKYTLVWKNVSKEDGTKPQAYFCGAYDTDWNKTDLKLGYPSLDDATIEKPNCYDELKEIAEKMSKDMPFVRVDTYIINNYIYVGEMTFFPWGGYQKFIDNEWNIKLGNMINLIK